METFGSRLRAAMDKRGPLCVGIDPHPSLLTAWGLPDDPSGVAALCEIVVEALGSQVAVFKPQSAFFERFGARGAEILESTIRQLRQAGALVLLDVKRGDIGSTVSAYADAYLNPSSPMHVDAITATPYLGVGSLEPMFAAARTHQGGVFIVTLTSNPEGASIQGARTAGGATVAQLVLDEISQLNAGFEGLGCFGAVIGATVQGAVGDLSRVGGPFLVPGLGAQGGTSDDLCRIFAGCLSSVLPSYSRDVLAAGPRSGDLQAIVSKKIDELDPLLGSQE